MRTEEQLQDWERWAGQPAMMQAQGGYVVKKLVADVRKLQADNADLRRQVRDLEELLRREEARA